MERGKRQLPSGLDPSDQAFVLKIDEAGEQVLGTFAFIDFILVHDLPSQSLEILGAVEQAPDVGRNLVESKALAALDIERDQFFAKFGFEQFLGPGILNRRHAASIAPADAPTNAQSSFCRGRGLAKRPMMNFGASDE
jgi:hypothetical protein